MKTPCHYPGCPALLDKGGYCQAHKASAPKRHMLYDRHVRQRDPALAMAARLRGSERWRRVRAVALADHPLCADPDGTHARQGVTRTATQVHHIRPLATHPEMAYTASNLLCVCNACHAAIERRARADANNGTATQPELSSRKAEGNGPAFG